MLVRAGRLVTGHDQPVITDGALVLTGGLIKEVGPYKQLAARYSGVREIGGDEFLVIPGLINGHSHGRGLSDFQRGALDNTLETWRWDTRKFIPVPVYDDVAFSAARLLKSGVTATMHNPLLQNPAAFEAEWIEALQAYRDSGMRVLFCPGVANDNPFVYGDNSSFLAQLSDQTRDILTASPPPGALSADSYIPAVREFHAQHDGPMTRIGFGPIAPQWCTPDLLTDIGKAAGQMGVMVHIHAAQSIFQKIYAHRAHGRTLIAYLDRLGLLGSNLVIGHCVFPTAADIELLAESGTGVTHHPSCNLRVRNGIAPAFHMIEAGVRVGLGLDGKGINDDDDMIQEMKICYLLHRLTSLDLDSAHLSARQVLAMVTEVGSSLIGFGRELGRLEPGRRADVVLLDYTAMGRPFVDPAQDPIDVLLYRGLSGHVHTVIVDGWTVVEAGRLLTLDEEAIGSQLAEAASRPRTETEKARDKALDEVRTRLREYHMGWPDQIRYDPFFNVNSKTDGFE